MITDDGKKRQDAHPNGTPRYYSNPNTEDSIGVAGEIAFAIRYGLKPDLSIKPDGDGHVDFKICVNNNKIVTIDVKTAIKPYNLLIKEWEINNCSDILVLGKFYNDGVVEFIGWTKKEIIAQQPIKIFSSLGIRNYYLSAKKLFSMELLDKSFNENRITQIL